MDILLWGAGAYLAGGVIFYSGLALTLRREATRQSKHPVGFRITVSLGGGQRQGWRRGSLLPAAPPWPSYRRYGRRPPTQAGDGMGGKASARVRPGRNL
jgi:hypothetical protein